MMKKILAVCSLIISMLLISSIPGSAQSNNTKATEILDEVTQKTKAYKSIKMEFNYQMENAEANINELTSGKVLVSGDKYRLEIAGQLVISDGITIWTIIEDSEEVQVNEVSEDDQSFSPTKMLSDYSEDYKSKLDPKVNELNGIDVYLLELTPNEKKTFERVNLFINKNKMQPYRMEIFDYNQSVYTYTITTFDTDITLSDNDFTFSEADYPNFDVIDMR
ncbi:MAG: outer membrane lipoprotein carrier protein LolA [Bacteroidales bacterium]|nr:outer membrane lipoprotein carrier protein LolA [Bacteroidales bacterium]